jgi:hypothetical protein
MGIKLKSKEIGRQRRRASTMAIEAYENKVVAFPGKAA